MPRTSKLTPAEWDIMETIWEMNSSPSVRQVLDHAFPKGQKAYTTVQTIMNTLVKKGLLKTKKIGLVNFYTPIKSRKEMVKREIKTVAARIFNGSVPALANYLIDTEDLDLDEIEQIKSLLNKKAKQLKG